MLTLIIIIITAHYILETIISYLNMRNWSPVVPEMVKDIYDAEKYKKAHQYAKANFRLQQISGIIYFVILLLAITTGFFGWLDGAIRNFTSSPVFIAILFFGVIGFAGDILSLPFSVYKTFVIEERFGFNRISVRTFIIDRIKAYILAIILGGGIIALLVKIFELTGENFWWLAWICMVALMLLMTMFYASWILPLFNKLTPLGDGELRNAISDYSKRNNFPLDEIFVIDGSKRSNKANAFFSGLGKKKKIVLFDTLIREHSTEELVAVLAHETGHYKLKHTLTGFIAGITVTGIMLFIFSLLQNNEMLYKTLGAAEPGLHLSLFTFVILYTPVSMLTGIFSNILSRKNEFEADDFARKTYNGKALISALKKLSSDNLSNLTPHPLYVFFNYSHPPLLDRLYALDKFMLSGSVL